MPIGYKGILSEMSVKKIGNLENIKISDRIGVT